MITRPDPVSLEEWLAADLDEDEPPDFDEDDLDPEGSALPWDEDLAAIVAETDQIMAERAADAEFLARPQTAELAGAVLADEAEKRGPRGPGLPGSAERIPGGSSGPAGGFGAGECLDTAPGSAVLHGFVERAVDSGRMGEASDDEIIGLIAAADRTEASACSLKHAAVAELLRRRPAPGAAVLEGTAGMPEAYLDSAAAEVKWALAETRQAADQMLGLAWDLTVKLPGTRALFRDGRLRHAKVAIIAGQTAALDADEARQAEEQVLGRAPGLSPGRLRNQIKHAVARVNPTKAKDRRERGARNARVERWAEDSGNAGLAIREAPPPHRPAGHPARPGRPARRDPRPRPRRPVAGPGPRRRLGRQPQDLLVPDYDRQQGTGRRPRLRPPRTPPQCPCRARSAWVHVHPGRPRTTRRIRHLALHHRDPRPAGLDPHHRPHPRQPLRSPVPSRRPRSWRQAPPPDHDPPRHLMGAWQITATRHLGIWSPRCRLRDRSRRLVSTCPLLDRESLRQSVPLPAAWRHRPGWCREPVP